MTAHQTIVAVDPTDIVAQINGNFGRWQLRTILLIFLCKIPSAWFMACVIYTAPTPKKGDYYCKPLNVSDAWVRMSHASTEEQRLTDRQFHVDACNIYEEALEQNFAARYANYSNPFKQPQSAVQPTHKIKSVIPCAHFEHSSDYQSLITQFDLVCSRQLLVCVSQSFHALGTLLGGLLAPQTLKNFSPRRLMLIGMLFQIVCGNLTGLVSTYHLHVFYRCLTACFCALMYTSGQFILMDITNGNARTIVTTLFELFWSIGIILLPGVSIFFSSWSYLYIFISSSVMLLVLLHRWIADSPRWLLRHNQIEAALQLLLESAAFNNRKIPLDLEPQLETYAQKLQTTSSISYWSIWDGKTDRKFIVGIHVAWSLATILYNVPLLMVRQMGIDHIHVNTASLGFAEIFGVFLGLYFILYTRRHWLWSGYLMALAGAFTFLVWLVPPNLNENRRIGALLIFRIILKMANSAALSVLTTCTGDMVAAEKRAMLMLSVITFSRFWLLIGPYISTLIVINPLLPLSIFASLAVGNGLIMLYLNCYFWNHEHPRIENVPTPAVFRRNSSILLLDRGSVSAELNIVDRAIEKGCDNPLRISISELWNWNARYTDLPFDHAVGGTTTKRKSVVKNNVAKSEIIV